MDVRNTKTSKNQRYPLSFADSSAFNMGHRVISTAANTRLVSP